MSMTELERHLLEGLEKLQGEFAADQDDQNERIAQLFDLLEQHAQTMQQLSEFYRSLEPLLERLNNLLQSEGRGRN